MVALTERMAGAEFGKFPSTTKRTSVHLHQSTSSNNPAEPDPNQNHNLTATCLSNGPCFSSITLIKLLLLASFLISFWFVHYLRFPNFSFSVASHIPPSSLYHLALSISGFTSLCLNQIPRIPVHIAQSLLFFFHPISSQTASPATVLLVPSNFLPTHCCTAFKPIVKKYYHGLMLDHTHIA